MNDDRTLPDDRDNEQSEIDRLIRESPMLRLVNALHYTDLTRREVRIVMVIMAKSLKADGSVEPTFISLKEFSRHTMVSASHVCDIRAKLLQKNLVTVTYPGTARLPFYAVVPDPADWLIRDNEPADSGLVEGQPDHG